ncbi:MAG: peptide deformylase [Bdellovibrionales bacterium]|nr:peptide deformylase [Bdellovibrionales bacterium]
MAVRKVIRMGHPTLRKVAGKLTKQEIQSEETKALLQDMFDTMLEQGGIGIAAPQINVSKSVAIIQINPDNDRYDVEEEVPMLVFFNPEIEILDKTKQGFWEGCLSVPGLRGYVERPQKVKVTYLDIEGQKQELIAEDFLATVVQHELDHLFGKLYIDRVTDREKLMFEDEYLTFHQDEDEPEID